MNVEHIRLLVRVAERGSISAAARDLAMSPSLATRHLARLEKSVGTTLLARTTRRLALTEAGGMFVAWARTALDGLDMALDQLADLETKPSGPVRFACPELLAARFLSGILVDLASRYPDIRLSLVATDRIQDLSHDRFDAAIHIGERPGSPLIVRKVLDVQPVLCATPGYVSQHGVPAHPQDLACHRILSHALYHARAWTFQRHGVKSSYEIQPQVKTTSSTLLYEMALKGGGIARLTRRLAATDLSTGRLVEILPDFHCVSGDQEPASVWVIRPGRYLARRTRVVLDAVVAHLRATG
jgi:LysR family transcriptional activator of dmlA